MSARTIKVSNVSLGARDRDLREFFSFSGDIENVEMQSDAEGSHSQVAYVTFKDSQGAEIAVLLTGATIVDQSVSITLDPDYQLPPAASAPARTIKVSNVSLGASDQDLKKFFSFSGDIENVEMQSDAEGSHSQVAYVTFKDSQGAETAVLLTGATIVDLSVSITLDPDYQLPPAALAAQAAANQNPSGAESTFRKAEDVVRGMLAKGHILGKDALGDAKSLDEKLQLTSTSSANVASLGKKTGFTEKITAGTIVVADKVGEVDQKSQVSKKRKTTTRYLVPELITNILIRSQVKCLLRFRCLSKWWCSEIDDPKFVQWHLSSGSPQPLIYDLTLRYQFAEDFLCLPREENFLPLPFRDNMDTNKFEYPLSGSCNGLVILFPHSQWTSPHIIIWNPFTRKHRVLYLTCRMIEQPSKHPHRFAAFGIGYDSLSDDYKVFRLLQSTYIQFSVYSFKSKKWTHYFWLRTEWILVRGCESVVAHGAIHFMVAGKQSPLKEGILAWNLHTTSKRRMLPRLPDCEPDFNCFPRMEVFGDRLCVYFGKVEFRKMDVWVLENYGTDEESWARFFCIRLPNLHDFAPPSQRWKELLPPACWTCYEWLDFKLTKSVGSHVATLLVPSLVSVGEDKKDVPEGECS